MKVCGIEIKGKEAVICLLSSNNGLFEIGDCRARSLVLSDADTAEGLLAFQATLAKLVEDYRIEKIVIKERMKKGKFAGGADGFKLEAAIQLIEGLSVSLISATRIKELLKLKPLPILFADTGLKMFQEAAFKTAYAALIDTSESSPTL
ncbi:DUF3010 family protein [Teredinibacter purpureus]|uniref:DUF3010 family protein n=1 Tax=Teredinibacter purpureus TaxID=2731756 RepID=UPI0005F86879|nr:DUF3010 family protein [Teredinibacter purpureus]